MVLEGNYFHIGQDQLGSIPKVVCELQKDMPDQLKLVFCSFFASPKCVAFMNTIKKTIEQPMNKKRTGLSNQGTVYLG